MDINEKQKLYILFGIFGIVAIMVYYNLLLKPQFSSFIAHNREYYAVRKRVKDAKILIANEDRIKTQLDSFKKQSELFEKKLPSQDEVSSLLEDFSDIAESSEVKILRIKPLEVIDSISGAEVRKELYYEFPILIEARGGYHQCGIFINKLENMDRFIRIDEIDIRGTSRDPRHHDIRLRASTCIMH